jgi:hypothetical protein
MYDPSAILRLADKFVGLDPNAVIEQMKRHEAAALKAEQEWKATRDWRCRLTAQREFDMERAAQLRLAIDFGAARGWKLTNSDFGLRTLAEGKQHDGRQRYSMFGRHTNPSAGDYHYNFDHPYYYRRDRKAAAIAAHLYNYPNNRAACEKLAAEFGLEFEVPDFPSWWNPGATTLVVYVGPAGRLVGQATDFLQ